MTIADTCNIGLIPVLDYAINVAYKECKAKPSYVILHPLQVMELRASRNENVTVALAGKGIRLRYCGIPIIEQLVGYPFLRDAKGKEVFL